MDEKADTSSVCLNGHMINNRTHTLPELNKKFCSSCGEPTTSSCPNCKTDILGAIPKVRQINVISETGSKPETEFIWPDEPKKPTAYCHNCGKPYPWTERKIQATVEMIDLLEDIPAEEKTNLKADIPDIMHNSPRSEVACMRYKTVLGKISGMARDVFVNVVSDIASETIKKSMGLTK